jgi:uncharacterized protein with HEPN domain
VKDERVYLLHALEAIDAIQRYTVDGRDAFFADAKTQDAVIRNVEHRPSGQGHIRADASA